MNVSKKCEHFQVVCKECEIKLRCECAHPSDKVIVRLCAKCVSVLCDECGWAGKGSALLTAENPFVKNDVLSACPECKELDIRVCCEIEGCNKKATCGTPVKDGYISTCGRHRPEAFF